VWEQALNLVSMVAVLVNALLITFTSTQMDAASCSFKVCVWRYERGGGREVKGRGWGGEGEHTVKSIQGHARESAESGTYREVVYGNCVVVYVCVIL
jgi:hypothetical protein